MSCGLRDVLEIERMGRPAVLVASSAFEETASRQAEALGQPAARRLFVAHPVQDRDDEEMRAMARAVADSALEALSAAPSL